MFLASLLLYGHVVAIVPKQSRNKQNSVKLLFRLAFGPLSSERQYHKIAFLSFIRPPKNSCSSVFFVSSWNQQRKPQDLTWELICWAWMFSKRLLCILRPPPPPPRSPGTWAAASMGYASWVLALDATD